jgi:enoyl-CoA hydratase
MPEYEQILYEKKAPFAWVRLNRPRYRNAQSQVLLEEMDRAFAEAGADDDVRVIILCGEGDHFSSGHDLGTPEELADQERQGYKADPAGMYARMSEIYLDYGFRWRDIPKPTIAAIHGYCIYGGWQIASSMDVVIAADDTQLLPGFIEYFSVPWDLGIRKSKEILFQNKFISAEEGMELGFVNKVVKRDELEAETMAMAESFAETDPFRIRMLKLSINQAQDAMGYRLAIQSALSNFVLMAQDRALLSDEEKAAGKKSLPTVDMALKKSHGPV